MKMLLPGKIGLTVATFVALVLLPQVVPALKNYKSLNPADIPYVWDIPIPKPAEQTGPNVDLLRAKRLELMAPKNLVDPAHALRHFYASLLKGGTIRVAHYGDSPTTADLITSDARGMLQKEFGDGGTGFVLIARPWAWYNHRGVEMEASGWKIDVAGSTELKDGMHGLGGASFRGKEGSTARWTLKDGHHTSVDISYLSEPESGAFEFEADGQVLGTTDTSAPERGAGYASYDLPPGSTHFTVRVTKGTVRLYGADFRKPGPGVVYSSLGINGASVTLLSRSFNNAHWTAELHHYNPDLVVLGYGTNESGYPEFVDSTWASELKTAVKRVQAALPEASILLMSPMDRGEKRPTGEIETIATIPRLVSIEERVANETGVAFFDTYEAMGGQGTMARWYAAEPRLVGADYIHPMPGGAKIVGELLYDALRDGYNAYKLRELKDRAVRASGKVPSSEGTTP